MSVSRNTKKRVRIASMLAVAFIATGSGVAAGGIRVEPQCPSSISPGGTLTIELKLTNTTQTKTIVPYNGQPFTYETGEPITIAKSGLIAHIGNLNVLGPFVIPLSETIQPQPPITIDFSKPTPGDEVSITTNGYLNVAFPTNATKGTFTNMLIYVLDEKNNTLGGGECVIEVR